MRIREALSPTVCIRYEERAGEIFERIQSTGFSHLIVTRGGEIAGVISEKDLPLADAESPIGDAAKSAPIVDSSTSVIVAERLMRSGEVDCLPVVDDGVIAGVITLDAVIEAATSPSRRQARSE